jgi:membrane protease YdiL (CAAX protease family)
MRETARSVESMRSLLPRDDADEASFRVLSVTAGICEEVLYRGFALAVLTPLVGVIGAVIGSSIGFGLGHAYQGSGGFLKTTAVGLVMAGLVLLAGSLWVAMVLHAAVDLNGGALARRCLAAVDAEAAAATVEGAPSGGDD